MWACIQRGVVVVVKLQSRFTQCCSVTTDILKNIFLFSLFAPQCKQTLYYTGPLNPPLWHLHMAGKCFIFAPICLHCCIAYLTACSDIWVWPFCAACANHWNKSIDIKIIKPFTFYCNSDFFPFILRSDGRVFCSSAERERADNDHQLVAISGMLTCY